MSYITEYINIQTEIDNNFKSVIENLQFSGTNNFIESVGAFENNLGSQENIS